MAHTSAATVRRIVAAFERRTLPEDAPIFFSYSVEVDTERVERIARQSRWMDLPEAVLCENGDALFYMTPEAFAWFLPAYMVLSIDRYAENRPVTSSIITCLMPQDEADARLFQELVDDVHAIEPDLLDAESSAGALAYDEALQALFMQRANALTAEEKAAVRDYLEYIQAAHGADFPVFDPKAALDRYWAH